MYVRVQTFNWKIAFRTAFQLSVFYTYVHARKSLNSSEAPSTRMRIFLKTEVFFSVLALRPHVNGVFGMRKRRFSKTLARVEVFENAVFVFTCRRVKTEVFENAVFVFTCGRVKTEVFENDDVIIGSSL